MRALLSTRLFTTQRFDAAPLRLARDHGFVDLELHADPRWIDVLSRADVARVARRLGAEGMRAPWLHLGPAVLNRLTDERCRDALADGLRALGVEVIAATTNAWGVRQDGGFGDLRELQMLALQNGARLVLDAGRIDERVVGRLPGDLGLCWDMATPPAHEGRDAIRELDEMLEGVDRGRLLGVRVSGMRDGRRAVPDEAEAVLLEEVWRLQAPGTLVYDVEDPSGFGAEPELAQVLGALRSFHAGEKRPHPEGSGGIFWAGLAPG